MEPNKAKDADAKQAEENLKIGADQASQVKGGLRPNVAAEKLKFK